MNSSRGAVRLLVGVATVLVASLALSVPAGTAAKQRNVFWVDLAGQAEKAPGFVYFTANSGGQVNSLTWKRWGARKAIGKGKFFDSSASFPGKLNRNGPARLVAWKPIKCIPEFGNRKGKPIRIYRHVRMRYPNGKGGKTWGNVSATAGFLACK